MAIAGSIRFDMTKRAINQAFTGLEALKAVFNRHVSVMRIKRINDRKRLFNESILWIMG